MKVDHQTTAAAAATVEEIAMPEGGEPGHGRTRRAGEGALRDESGTAGSNARDLWSLTPGGPAAGEEDPEPVVPDAAEASAWSLGLLDEQVRCLDGAVGGTCRVVSKDRCAPRRSVFARVRSSGPDPVAAHQAIASPSRRLAWWASSVHTSLVATPSAARSNAFACTTWRRGNDNERGILTDASRCSSDIGNGSAITTGVPA